VLVTHKKHVDALLEGLPSSYALAVSVIESKKCPPSITKIEALIYRHETHLSCYPQESQNLVSPSLNYTQSFFWTWSWWFQIYNWNIFLCSGFGRGHGGFLVPNLS